MPATSTPAYYKSESTLDNLARHPIAHRPDDFSSVEEFLLLLARAVRQFHTYPPTSPVCSEAIAACHKVFASFEHRDRLVIRVTPTELVVDEQGVGAGTIIEHELVRRLHPAHTIALDFDRVATPLHLSHFCTDVIRCSGLARTKTTLAELLTEHGVDSIVAVTAHRPEVLDVGAPSVAVCNLVGHEQQRREKAAVAGGPVDYLYPPDKGWVRLDPGAQLKNVSLVDLAVLVDNPVEIATILLRLTDDDPVGAGEHRTALERKFSDVTTLFASLDPRLARVMFGKLSRAVLDLEPESRKGLLRRTILPGLLDGCAEGAVLRDFPDVDLADSLCLLLELETAAPEVLTAAFNRLEMPSDRRQTVLPLIDERLRRARAGETPADASVKERDIDRLARRLIRVEAEPGKDFSEFSAFDLSIDEQTATAITAARDAIDATDVVVARLGFLANLVRLEPNPGVVGAFLRCVLALFAELEELGRSPDLATWASHYRQLANELRESRPDVADAISKALIAFYDLPRASALVDRYQSGDDGRVMSNALIEAFGVAVVPGLVAVLDDTGQARATAAVSLMCEHARLFAPVLVPETNCGGTGRRRAVLKVLGFSGAGYEGAVAEQLGNADEQVSREALRALARIGTAQAAAVVARQLQDGRDERRAAAEEALWHFPPTRAAAQVTELLRSQDFVVQHPQAAGRLLERAAHAGTHGLDEVLAKIEHLRFRFWSPGVVRVALKARELRGR